jgi:hypothetical protein
MSRNPSATALVAAALGCAVAFVTPALAHSVAGARIFPATLGIDDPGVSDELALPTITSVPDNGDGDGETDFSFEFAKTITPDFAISIGDTYVTTGSGDSGFDNVGIGLKYQAYVNPEHEFMASIGLDTDIGGTGGPKIGDPFTTFTPSLYAGKGFGDLPSSDSWLRPFAVTGQLGYAVPTDPNEERALEWGFTLQYSLPYLNANVHQMSGPEFFQHLIPITEFAFETPTANAGGDGTTGTIQPGVVYMADTYQIAAEALIPINAASGRGVGFITELHFFLDDIFPNTLGKPLFP